MATKLLTLFRRDLSPNELPKAETRVTPEAVAFALRTGVCPLDSVFDEFLPDELRVLSRRHWTPLMVALCAAQWLDSVNVRSVVDIGSGAGKFCIALALAGRASVFGIEHRERLVGAARALARTFDVEQRVTFLHRTFGVGAVPPADAYYMYNPFGENLDPSDGIDEDVELGVGRYDEHVRATETFLGQVRIGTYLLTYNGFGGDVPAPFEEVRVDRSLPDVLKLWKKVRP